MTPLKHPALCEACIPLGPTTKLCELMVLEGLGKGGVLGGVQKHIARLLSCFLSALKPHLLHMYLHLWQTRLCVDIRIKVVVGVRAVAVEEFAVWLAQCR